MAKRSPMATGGEGRGSKPARQGPGGVSPKLKEVAKGAGKLAAEETAMAIFPAARFAKIVGKGAKALGKAMGKGFDSGGGARMFSSEASYRAAKKAHEKAGFDDDLSLELIYGDGPDLPSWWKRLPEKEKVKIYKQHSKPKDTDFVDKKTGRRQKVGGGFDILEMLTGFHGKKNATEQAVRLYAETGKNPAVIKHLTRHLEDVVELKPALRKAAEAKAKK